MASTAPPGTPHYGDAAETPRYGEGGRPKIKEVQRALDGIMKCSPFTSCAMPKTAAGDPKVLAPSLEIRSGESSSGGGVYQPLTTPDEGFRLAASIGAKKGRISAGKGFLLAIMAGTHIAFGGYLAIYCGGNMPNIKRTDPGLQSLLFGVFGFPLGLFMTVLSGAELVTGNFAVVSIACMEGLVRPRQLASSLAVAWCGNFVGAAGIAALVTAAGTFGELAHLIAASKLETPCVELFFRALLGNWLVCTAVYTAAMCKDATGKAIAIFLPISAFAALALEHTVANMFIIPAALLNGAPLSFWTFLWRNLLPVTLGNFTGALVGVALPFTFAFGSVGRRCFG